MYDWTVSQTLTFAVLLFPTISAILIPLVYIPRANLRDPLAKVLAAVTTVTAIAFLFRCWVSALYYSGASMDTEVWHWSSRLMYVLVGCSHALFLAVMLRILRTAPSRLDVEEATSE